MQLYEIIYLIIYFVLLSCLLSGLLKKNMEVLLVMDNATKKVEIPYVDPLVDFAPFADKPGSFLLHSAMQNHPQGRYSFWGAHPLKTTASYQELKRIYRSIEDIKVDSPLHFSGGLVGFFGYDWGASLEKIYPVEQGVLSMPSLWFGFYDPVVVYDHQEGRACVTSLGLGRNASELKEKILENRKSASFLDSRLRGNDKGESDNDKWEGDNVKKDLKSNFTKAKYLEAVKKVQQYLREGDSYQINLSQSFVTNTKDTPWSIFEQLMEKSPAPYSAFIQCENFSILSASPESFLETKGERLITRPIKGTRPRQESAKEDEAMKEELISSEKDLAELLMITDLERNDLGKVCLPGSVEVSKLRELQSFAQVHHLVSQVEGICLPDKTIFDCIEAMIPGGSITGAPKIRAMEIIYELEKQPRHIYTGAIGWLGPQNQANLNVAIRTIVIQNQKGFFNAGGGVVIDSDPEREYEETLVKAKGMRQALGF